MNYALKIVLNKVIKNYLNLSEQLELDSGVIKMSAGTLNHQSLNHKLKHLDIQIRESTYKGLNIGIPVMELMTKPIKVKIDLFQVLIHIGKPSKTKKQEQQHKMQRNQGYIANLQQNTRNQSLIKHSQQNQQQRAINQVQNRRKNLPKVSHYKEDSPSTILVKSLQKKDVRKQEKVKQNVKLSKTTPQQTSWSSQYLKETINRILYNLEVSIQKAKITVVLNSQILPHSQTIKLQINQLHIRNSISNLQANIIKKTINLKQLLLLSQKLGVVKIQDFNVGLDYAFQQLKIIAIVWNVKADFGKLTNLKEKQSFFVKAMQNFLKKSSGKSKQKFDQKQLKIEDKNIQFDEQNSSSQAIKQQQKDKRKMKTISIYLRVNQISIRAFRLLLRSYNLQSRIFLNNSPQQLQKTFSLNLNSINLYSTYNKDQQLEQQISQNSCLLQFKAITRNSQQQNYFKRVSEYEDINLKNAMISYEDLEGNVVVKVYHMMIKVIYSKAKKYIHNILQDYYDLFGQVLLVFKLTKQKTQKNIISQNSIPSQSQIAHGKQTKRQSQKYLIIYKAMITVQDFINPGKIPLKDEKLIIIYSTTLTQCQNQTILRIIEFKAIFNLYKLLKFENLRLFIEKATKKDGNLKIRQTNVTIAGGDLISQTSFATLLRISKGFSKIVNDITQIHILFDRFLRRQARKIIQKQRTGKRKSDEINKLKQSQQKITSTKWSNQIKKNVIYFKMLSIQIKVGHYLLQENDETFYTIFELQLSSIILRFVDQKERISANPIQQYEHKDQISVKSSSKSNVVKPKQLKLKFDLMGYFYSPHTLQKAPFTNQIKVQISKYDRQFSIISKNNLNLFLDDSFIKVIQLYSKSQLKEYYAIKNDSQYDKTKHNPFAKFINCTNQKLFFCQNKLKVSILPHSTKNIFFEGTKATFILSQQSQDSEGKKVMIQISSKQVDLNAQNINQKQQVLNFDHREEKNIFLSWISSQQILIKNKFLIGFYPVSSSVEYAEIRQIFQDVESKLDGQKINIKMYNMHSKQFLKIPNSFQEQKSVMYSHYQDASFLQEIAEQNNKFQVRVAFSNEQRTYKIDNLMKNEKFGLYGLKCNQNPLYDYYILQRKSLSSVYMQILPFLVIENQLQTELYIRLKHRKTQEIEEYSIPSKGSLPILSNSRFDFYMKQFTFAVMILPTMSEYEVSVQNRNNKKQDFSKIDEKSLNKQSSKQTLQMEPMEQFLSEQHYFNTFFMVEDQFQTVIELRSDKKNRFQKEYLLITESILCKTKVLTFSSPIKIVNKSSFKLGFQYQQRVGLLKKMKIQKGQSVLCQLQIKDGDIVNLLYQDLPENTIEVSYKNLSWALNNVQKMVLLFFNFCKIPEQIMQGSNEDQNTNFYQVAICLKFSIVKGVQTLLFQDLIQLTNLTKSRLSINQRNGIILKSQDKMTLMLPSTTDFRYNNKAVQMNIGISDQMDNLYKALFIQNIVISNSVKKDQSVGNTSHSSQQNNGIRSKISQKPISINFSEYPNWDVSFNELLLENSKESPTNQGKEKKIFTLLKDLKRKISFYICEDIYNTNGHYTIFRNNSDRHFLMNLDKHQYSSHFKPKGMQLEDQQAFSDREQKQQKILIQPFSCNKMIQRKNEQVLLCDQKQSHLHKLTKQNLEKEKIKYELHEFTNFSLYDIEQQTQQDNNFQVQLITNAINIKVRSKSTMLTLSLNALTFRMLQKNKFDCLLTDITISEQQNGKKSQILFVPEQAYFLLQGKPVDQKFYLIKNMFIKCKHAILNIHDKLPNGLLALYKAFGLQQQENKNKGKIKESPQSAIKQESDQKLQRYLQESIFLVKNIYIHEIHLSLTIKMQSLDFSNTITLLPFSLSSKTMKYKNLKNQVSKFYLTNMLAKFPKLSFFLQNLKNPMNIIKTLFSIRQAIKDKIVIKNIIKLNQNPQLPKYFSLQAYNILNREVQGLFWVETHKKYYIIQNEFLVIMSTPNSQRQQKIKLKLKQLQKIKMIRNKAQSEVAMKFKDEINVNFFASLKRCEYFMYVINSILD